MHRQTKRTMIPAAVKDRVFERDHGRCVMCGRVCGLWDASAHFVARAQGGLGIEQNILTLCSDCHHRYDQTAERHQIREILRDYLKEIYPEWEESTLIYKKGMET